MTRIYGIAVLNHTGGNSTEPRILAEAQDVSQFNFFQRKGAAEFMTFTSKLVTQRTQSGQRQSVQQHDYMCHCFVRTDGLGGVILSDNF